MNALDTVLLPGRGPITWRPARITSADVVTAPETTPSASPRATRPAAKNVLFVKRISRAFSTVMPFFARRCAKYSHNSSIRWYIAGLMTSAPDKSIWKLEADFLISFKSPMRTTRANPFANTRSAAFSTRRLSVSGRMIFFCALDTRAFKSSVKLIL